MIVIYSGWLSLFVAVILSGVTVADVRPTVVSPAVKNSRGILVHTVKSPYQSSKTKIRVLLPDRIDDSKRYSVLYILPVEAKDGNRYGDGLQEARKLDLHNRFNLICVAPTFSHLPWYTNHPTDTGIRQESYLLKVVIPAIEKHYPTVRRKAGRLLVGFSKSGWGAFSLLLRHPDMFGKAAAWDAPLMKAKPNQFGMGPIFGTQKNFDNYRISTLVVKQADKLGKTPRLILTGYGNFRRHHQQLHRLMVERNLPHEYSDGPKRKHHWSSGWLEETVKRLRQ